MPPTRLDIKFSNFNLSLKQICLSLFPLFTWALILSLTGLPAACVIFVLIITCCLCLNCWKCAYLNNCRKNGWYVRDNSHLSFPLVKVVRIFTRRVHQLTGCLQHTKRSDQALWYGVWTQTATVKSFNRGICYPATSCRVWAFCSRQSPANLGRLSAASLILQKICILGARWCISLIFYVARIIVWSSVLCVVIVVVALLPPIHFFKLLSWPSLMAAEKALFCLLDLTS